MVTTHDETGRMARLAHWHGATEESAKLENEMAVAHHITPYQSRALTSSGVRIKTTPYLVIIIVEEGDERIEISLNPKEAQSLYQTLKQRF